MILMTNGKKKKFVADALVAAYEKKGFSAVKPAEAETAEPAEAEPAEAETAETTAKKSTTRKKAAE